MRSVELLNRAAAALEEGIDPFQGEWLADNDVTFDECMDLSDSLAAGARLVAWAVEHPEEAATALNGAQLSTASRLLARALDSTART